LATVGIGLLLGAALILPAFTAQRGTGCGPACAAEAPANIKPVARIRHATQQVYRLIVEVEGAVKGGTSFLVSGRRVIATNYHVVEKGSAFTIGFMDDKGRIRRVPVRLVAAYPQKDLALLESLDDLPGEPLPLFTAYPDPATDLVAIGFPAAADPQGAMSWTNGNDDTFFVPSVIKGYVSRVLPNRWFSSQLQHQTPIIPGYSGGPLVDEDGAVVGISTSVHKEANGISYGVLGADLAEFAGACGLPVNAHGSPPRSSLDRQAGLRAPATLNTFSMQRSEQGRQDLPKEDQAMLHRAQTLLINGDIIAARQLFDYLAVRRSIPEALAGLAKSYDPAYLRDRKVLGIMGDAGKAEAFYKQAATLGSEEAKRILAMGSGSGCMASLCRLVNTESGPTVLCERGRL
jgi:S1-C subfamily serine protease